MRNRKYVLASLLLLFLALAAVAQFQVSLGYAKKCSGWLLLASVAGTAICLLLGTRDGGYVAEHVGERSYRPRIAVRVIALAALAAGAVLLFLSSRGLALSWTETYYRSFLLMAVGYALAGLGLDHLFGYTVRYRPMGIAQRRMEVLLLILIIGITVFMRTYRFDYYPPPDGIAAIEEAQQGDRAFNMMYENARPWEFLFSNFASLASFKLFGGGMNSLRFPPVVLSCVTVIIGYFLLRTLVGYRVALFCTFLFAVSRWHLTYSRISHNVFLPAVLVVLCVYLLYRTTVSSRLSLYLWIGLTAGLLLYAYAPYRGTVFLAIIFFSERAIRSAVSTRRSLPRGRLKALGNELCRNIHGPLIVALSMLVLALPLLSKLDTMPGFYFEAARRAIAKESEPSWYDTSDMGLFLKRRVERVRAAGRIFTVQGDGAATFNKPGEPMLNPFTGILFILAVGCCTATLTRERHTFMVICFYLTMGMGFLFPHNFDVRRMITLIPLVYALIGLFAFALWQFFCPEKKNAAGVLLRLFMVAVCVISFIYNFNLFFNKQIKDPEVRKYFWNEYTEMSTLVRRLPPGTFAIVVTPALKNLFLPNDYKWYRGFEVKGMVVEDPLKAIALTRLARRSGDVVVVINHKYDIDDFSARMRREFPGATEERFGKDMWGGRWAWAALSIPAEGKEEAAAVQRVEGFSEIIGKPQTDYMEDARGRVRSWKASGVGGKLAWTTDTVPEKMGTLFLFGGSCGAGGKPATARLFVNDEFALEFELGYVEQQRRWEKEGYVLEALPLRTLRDKNILYCLTVPERAIVPGQGVRISLEIIEGGADTWFAVHERSDCWSFLEYGVVM